MRLLLLVLNAWSALVFYVNAAAFDKRDVSAPIVLCLSDIAAIENQFTSLKTTVDGFTTASGFSGLLSVHSKVQAVVSQLQKAGTDCCASPTVISTEEANAVLVALTSLVPDVEGAMTSFVTKKPQFQSFQATAVSLMKNDIISMHTKHTPLNACLLSVEPPILIPEQKSLFDRIEIAYTSAERAYTNSPSPV